MDRINLVIATYNSQDRLGATLESFHAALDKARHKSRFNGIIIANNNSFDRTKDVALSYQNKLPITVIDVPSPGKSKALNAIISEHLNADIILLTDDDTAFTPEWFDRMVEAFDHYPDYGVFAGRIVGVWEKEVDQDLASWIPMGSTYAVHDRDTSGACDPGLVWGPNMGVRRDVFKSGHRYDERIGPSPAALYAMGEETAFATEAARRGFPSYFVADAVVEHTIKADTANEDWVIKRAERLGYGIFAIKNIDEYKREMPSFIPLYAELFINKWLWFFIYPFTCLLPRSKHRFWMRWRRYYYQGLWRGYQEFSGSA